MSRRLRFARSIVVGLAVGGVTLTTHVSWAEAQSAAKAIVLEDLTASSAETLPLGILRRVVLDRASRGDETSCPDLRRCDELDLRGVSVDLDEDGSKEWLVTDLGFTGTGAELDYIFKKGTDRRWKMVGRIEGIHLRTVGPKKTAGFLDIQGEVAGVCVEGSGKAVWNGDRYVGREGRVKPRPC